LEISSALPAAARRMRSSSIIIVISARVSASELAVWGIKINCSSGLFWAIALNCASTGSGIGSGSKTSKARFIDIFPDSRSLNSALKSTTSPLDVADGNFQPAPVLKRSDEIGFLSRSFNRMVEKLQTTSEIENKYAETLRNQIRERTGELELKNIELVNARNELEKKVETRTLEFRKLNEYLINTEERERKKIANDLHDGVIQTLAISISKLKNLNDPDKGFDFAATGSSDELTAVQDTLTQAMKEIRLLTYQLSPPILYDFDLEIALGWLCEDLNVRYQMNVAYINKLNKKVVINEILKENLYKIVRELIINVLKHSGTTDAEIIISAQDNILVISVQDYGKGFDMNRVDKGSPWGFGLFGISERLKNFRGTIEINSKPAKGTIIVLKIPY